MAVESRLVAGRPTEDLVEQIGPNIMPELPADAGRPEEAARILAFATQGAGGDDECRLKALLEHSAAEIFPFIYADKKASFVRLLNIIRERRHELLVMEGTGVAGGIALLLGRLLYGMPYVVSSGDAVGPFLASRWPAFRPIFNWYERILCSRASGFVGWTPYLVGRALTFGCPRAMTAPGWAPYIRTAEYIADMRRRTRARLGIPSDSIVFGLAGSLAWSKRPQYCYGSELVQAICHAQAPHLRVLIVGDGNGRCKLEEQAGNLLGRKVILTGRVPREQVIDYLAAMDVASLPQSVDAVGSFRYSTKISEYLALKLPIVTNHIPAGYDLDYGGFWRIAGKSPWDTHYVSNLAVLMDTVSHDMIARKRLAIHDDIPEFKRDYQIARVTDFLNDVIAGAARRTRVLLPSCEESQTKGIHALSRKADRSK
jgi:hypothetical protein